MPKEVVLQSSRGDQLVASLEDGKISIYREIATYLDEPPYYDTSYEGSEDPSSGKYYWPDKRDWSETWIDPEAGCCLSIKNVEKIYRMIQREKEKETRR